MQRESDAWGQGQGQWRRVKIIHGQGWGPIQGQNNAHSHMLRARHHRCFPLGLGNRRALPCTPPLCLLLHISYHPIPHRRPRQTLLREVCWLQFPPHWLHLRPPFGRSPPPSHPQGAFPSCCSTTPLTWQPPPLSCPSQCPKQRLPAQAHAAPTQAPTPAPAVGWRQREGRQAQGKQGGACYWLHVTTKG